MDGPNSYNEIEAGSDAEIRAADWAKWQAIFIEVAQRQD
jgi:hypothetical protein